MQNVFSQSAYMQFSFYLVYFLFSQRFKFFCTQQIIARLEIRRVHRAQQHFVGNVFCYWQWPDPGFSNHVVTEFWRQLQ